MKIAVVGTGYVGLCDAVLMAQQPSVIASDISAERVELINHVKSPFFDAELEDSLATRPLNLKPTPSKQEVYAGANFVVIAMPTDYDPVTNHFDTSSIESVGRDIWRSIRTQSWSSSPPPQPLRGR